MVECGWCEELAVVDSAALARGSGRGVWVRKLAVATVPWSGDRGTTVRGRYSEVSTGTFRPLTEQLDFVQSAIAR